MNGDGITHMLKVKYLIKWLCSVPCSTSKRSFSRVGKL